MTTVRDHWEPCSPQWLAAMPEGACSWAPRRAGDGQTVSHYHPALPTPPAEQTVLRDRITQALDNAHRTHPCPVTGDQIWSGCVHYDDAGRVAGVGSCHSGRRADAVLAVLPSPVSRADVLREAADRLAELREVEREWLPATGLHKGEQELRRMADEAQPGTEAELHSCPNGEGVDPGSCLMNPDRVTEAQQDVDPVYDPRAWETYRRIPGCGCTAPAPVDCKIPHGTGAWLCVCHRLSGPPMKDTDPPGAPLSSEDEAIRRHFTHPNRCLSAHAGIYRCERPTGHLGGHRQGRIFWERRPEDDTTAAEAQQDGAGS